MRQDETAQTFILAILLVVVIPCAGCGDGPGAVDAGPAEYVSPESCYECHESEQQDWLGSHHQLAMDFATEATVLGDFDDAEFAHHDVTTRFFRRDGKFLVNTEGPDGEMADFEVDYVFGVTPLQQYMVELERGRVQCLTIAWDTLEKRWFSLYEERFEPGDTLHWTGIQMTWNYMCAECHSTDLRRNYDNESDTYHTSWFEISVGCQGCHGPGSRHVAWAEEADEDDVPGDEKEMGLEVRLSGPDSLEQIEACARCHSRRTILHDDHRYGEPFLDQYDLQLLTEPLYHADGHILDEVYVYGSFLQSKKYHQGVRCTNCHHPHATRMQAEGNALCTACHQSFPPPQFPTVQKKEYDTPEHHFHVSGEAGSFCVDCHMPWRNYMVNDPRKDHAFRIPRPDLTAKLGTPNACNDCHDDETAEWAAAKLGEWFPKEDGAADVHFAEAFAAAREGDPNAGEALERVLRDPEQPGIVRATALTEWTRVPTPQIQRAVQDSLEDDDAMVRAAAVRAVSVILPPGVGGEAGRRKAEWLVPLLSDPVRLVRVEATRLMTEVDLSLLSQEQRRIFERARTEYVIRQTALLDRPDGHFNMGVMHGNLGDDASSEAAYREALVRDPTFLPARFNLAMLLNRAGRNQEAEEELREVVKIEPEAGEGWYSLGLLLGEMERLEGAAVALGNAAQLLPDRPRVRLNHALTLQRLGSTDEAEKALLEALRLDGSSSDIVRALVIFYLQQDCLKEARPHAQHLVSLQPGDAEAMRLLRMTMQEGR